MASKGVKQPKSLKANSPDLVRYVVECFKADEERLRPIHETMDILWAQYRCQDTEADLAGLKPWQSRVYIPKANEAVDQAVTFVGEALFRRKDHTIWKPVDPEDKDCIPAQKATTDFYLKRAGFEDKVQEAIHSAFAMIFGVVKIGWESAKEVRVKVRREDDMGNFVGAHFARSKRTTGQLTLDVVHPKNYYTDAEHTHHIERYAMDWAEINRKSQGANPLFSPKAVRVLKEKAGDLFNDELEDIERSLDFGEKRKGWKKEFLIYEYWGPVYDRLGNLIHDNARLYIADETLLLNPHDIDNPWWTEEPPYYFFSPITIPFRKEGQAIHEAVVSVQKMINSLFRGRMDSLTFNLLSIFQVVPDWLEDPTDLDNLGPGDVLAVKPQALANGRGALVDAGFKDKTQGVFNDFDFANRAYNEGSHGAASNTSGPPVKRDVTAEETIRTDSKTAAQSKRMAKNVEKVVAALTCRAKNIILQMHKDLNHPRFKALPEVQAMGKEISGMSRAERLEWLTPDVDITVSGLSAYLEQMQSLEGMVRLLENAAKNPEIRARINWSKFFEKVLEASNVPDADELGLPPEMEEEFSQLEHDNYRLNLQGKNLQMQQAIAQMQAPPMPQPGQILEMLGQVLINEGGMQPEAAAKFIQLVGARLEGGQQQQPQQAPAPAPPQIAA